MDTQRETGHMVWRPRQAEDRATVRRQQKELRRIRQRARRETMSPEQIEQRRERGREYYQRKKNLQVNEKIKQENASVDQATVDQNGQSTESNMLKVCTTAEEIMRLQQQRRNIEIQQLVGLTEEGNTEVGHQRMNHIVQSGGRDKMNPRNNRLTHVKRQARNLDHQVATVIKDVRPQRLIHIKRQARSLSNGVVRRSGENGNYFPKLGNSLDNGSISFMHEPAQILYDISRLKQHTSMAVACNSRGSAEIDLNKRDADNKLYPYEDTDSTTSDSEEESDTAEVLAFLSGLSAKKGQC